MQPNHSLTHLLPPIGGAQKNMRASMRSSSIALIATSLASMLVAAPAQAAAGRTFVSAAGNDSNPCTITLPCRNLQAAYNAVAANGQIDVLDPGNYGSLTITGPVSIQGHGWAGMSTTTGAAITINSPGADDKIAISGVVLDGLGIAGTNGIQFNSGGSLSLRDSVIRDFLSGGIVFAQNTSNPTQIFVSNTLVADNRGTGIEIAANGSGTTSGVFDHVQIQNNGANGLGIITQTQTINLTVSDSMSASNASNGIVANSLGGTLVNVMVRNSTIANNGGDGLLADNTGATILVTRSTITGNAAGWATPGMAGGGGGGGLTGVVSSYGDNNIDGNQGANTEPQPALPYK
jgi:hypothetical protein